MGASARRSTSQQGVATATSPPTCCSTGAILGGFDWSRSGSRASSGALAVNTPLYGPEQVYGNNPVDLRADVFALGIVLYEMFTGRPPYWDSEIPRLLMKHVMEPVPHIREVRSDLAQAIDDVITIAMAKDPNTRYQTAGQFSEALNAATSGVPSRRARRRLTSDQMNSLLDALDEDGSGG
jgi:serine/threonine-protein kinase